MDVLRIDGSFGEGGGQILRTAIALSCITQKPIRLENIRKNRKKPGLRPQHLTAIKILGKITSAEINGLEIGSSTVTFAPGEMQDCILNEDVGTAGSISLILAGLIPAVSLCKKNLKITIKGGTDVPWSPTLEYTKQVLGEAYSRMGINYSVNVKKRGYYPSGGGIVSADISPCKDLGPIILDKRNTKQAELFCSFSKIPGEKMDHFIEQINDELESGGFKVRRFITNEESLDEGGSVLITSMDSGSIIGIDGLYERKAGAFSSQLGYRFVSSGMGTDEHLSDMLVIPASLTEEMSVFNVGEISNHLKTNLYVTSKFTGCKYGIGKIDGGYQVRITGNSDSCIK